jgi:hypothetical protein
MVVVQHPGPKTRSMVKSTMRTTGKHRWTYTLYGLHTSLGIRRPQNAFQVVIICGLNARHRNTAGSPNNVMTCDEGMGVRVDVRDDVRDDGSNPYAIPATYIKMPSIPGMVTVALKYKCSEYRNPTRLLPFKLTAQVDDRHGSILDIITTRGSSVSTLLTLVPSYKLHNDCSLSLRLFSSQVCAPSQSVFYHHHKRPLFAILPTTSYSKNLLFKLTTMFSV